MVYATTPITTVFNCYNEYNGVAFKWISHNQREADKEKMRGTTDWIHQIDRQIHRLKIYFIFYIFLKSKVLQDL